MNQSSEVPAWASVLPHREPDQVAFVVQDLAASLATWSAILGHRDWVVYRYDSGNTRDMTYRGASAEFEMTLALTGRGPQLELIQSDVGPSIYTEQLEQRGPGLHHFGYRVPSLDDTARELSALGFEPVQSGRGIGLDGDGGFAYYEFPGVDTIIELIEAPARRRPSLPLP